MFGVGMSVLGMKICAYESGIHFIYILCHKR